LTGIPERKKQLGRARHRWNDNYKTSSRMRMGGGLKWINLAQEKESGRLFESGVDLSSSTKGGEFLD
jgi:hypothetical protein